MIQWCGSLHEKEHFSKLYWQDHPHLNPNGLLWAELERLTDMFKMLTTYAWPAYPLSLKIANCLLKLFVPLTNSFFLSGGCLPSVILKLCWTCVANFVNIDQATSRFFLWGPLQRDFFGSTIALRKDFWLFSTIIVQMRSKIFFCRPTSQNATNFVSQH